MGITVFQGKSKKVVLHRLDPILMPLNMGIIAEVPQDELQRGKGQGKGQKLIRARRRFAYLPNIRSLMSLNPKAKAKV